MEQDRIEQLLQEDILNEFSYGFPAQENKLDDIVSKFCDNLDKTMQDIDIKMEKINEDIAKFKVQVAKRFTPEFRDKVYRYLDTVQEKTETAKLIWKRESNLRSDRVKKYWSEENGTVP